MAIFSLDYPITRSFRWGWIGPVSFIGACIAIIFLSVLNAALVGYETINVFQSDANVVQEFWYDRFMPYRVPKEGSLCDPHVFNVGDTFTTNYSTFAWSIQSIEKANAGISGVSYNGSVLNNCDVNGVYMSGDLRTWTIDYSVLVSCKNSGAFDVSATTSFTMTSLPGKLAPLLGLQRSVNSESQIGDGRSIILDQVIRTASEDLGQRVYASYTANTTTTPVLFSIQANFEYCPAVMGSHNCSTKPPAFNVTAVASVTDQGILVQNYNGDDGVVPRIMDDLLTAPISNIMQTIYAAARIDLGIDSPNNFLLHKEVIAQTLNATFPMTKNTPANTGNVGLVSELYKVWENPNLVDSSSNYTWMSQYLPLNVTGPAALQVVYLCKFQNRKSPGSLVVSILVATLSMFSSGWAIYLFIVTLIAKRHPESNQCAPHLADSQTSQPYHPVVTDDTSKYETRS
ncbi:hypothetical protein GALMADRAFT_1277344 [Galerina marginata CBS 339.88]|uniref:Transmembrane protein n=1 Tax=Galerina marginata (strain CBS 339.88) TaxID=685588 RepID=A0A067T6Y9_GALM3|nr:hypothetical protein GALMADRAFT_1277344 [Galerina marginata CBS 339.88]